MFRTQAVREPAYELRAYADHRADLHFDCPWTRVAPGGSPSVESWNLNDRLVYWVLFPALLFDVTARLEFSSGLIG